MSAGRRAREDEGIVGVSSTPNSAGRRAPKEDERAIPGSPGLQRVHLWATPTAHSNSTALHGLRLGHAQCYQRNSFRSNQVALDSFA